MTAHRFGIAVVIVATAAFALGAAMASIDDSPQWRTALEARSDALNREYGLGDYAQRRSLGTPGPDWLQALRVRSEALNRYYGLGDNARESARTKARRDWLVALEARSEALNRMYGLGEYAAKR